MSSSSLIALVTGVAAVSIGVYHVLVVAPRLRAFAHTLGGTGGGSEDASLCVARSTAGAVAEGTLERLAALETAVAVQTLRIGFLRYNSFSDVGSDQSFTLALLSDAGDGAVISSIFAREETRTYGKSVRGFMPQQGASKEEEAAIAMARAGRAAFARA